VHGTDKKVIFAASSCVPVLVGGLATTKHDLHGFPVVRILVRAHRGSLVVTSPFEGSSGVGGNDTCYLSGPGEKQPKGMKTTHHCIANFL
jgi:hypothetical protein